MKTNPDSLYDTKNGINEIIINSTKLKVYTINTTIIAKYCNICIPKLEISVFIRFAINGYSVSTIFWIGDIKYVENLNILDINNKLTKTEEIIEKKILSFEL